MKSSCPYSQCSHLMFLTIFPLRVDAQKFRCVHPIFFNQFIASRRISSKSWVLLLQLFSVRKVISCATDFVPRETGGKFLSTCVHALCSNTPKLRFILLSVSMYACVCISKKNLNAFRSSGHPPVRGENVKTFRWDHRLQRPNRFMVCKRVAQCS